MLTDGVLCQSDSLRDAETRCDDCDADRRSRMSDALLWLVRRDGLVWSVMPPQLQAPPLQRAPLLASRRQKETRRLRVESRVESTRLSPLLVYARVSRAAGVCGRVSRAAGLAGGLAGCISFF